MNLSIVVTVDCTGIENKTPGIRNTSGSGFQVLVKEFRWPVECETRSSKKVEKAFAGSSSIEKLRSKAAKRVQLPLFS
jgi:hypothetical protein